jgi:hypothetical protein
MWHRPDDTIELCSITLPAGGIIDIEYEWVLNDSEAPISMVAVSGATLGQQYHKQPDTNLVVAGNLNTIA